MTHASRPVNAAKPATAARIYDYILGGTHNFPADRQAAEAILAMFPHTRTAAEINRAFLRRAVHFLSQSGVKQYLDIGSGIPTEGNVHEVAQEIDPEARVVYVDIDPVAVAESMEMLEGNEFAIAIQGDARQPRSIVEHPLVRKVIDFDQPVAILLVMLLHFVHDDEEAHDLVRQLLTVAAPGSYLVIAHVVNEEPPEFVEHDNDQLSADLERVFELYRKQTSVNFTPRSLAEIEKFFAGLDLIEPGVRWLPELVPAIADDDPIATNREFAYYVAVGGIAKLSATK